jgi:hypothetical protein
MKWSNLEAISVIESLLHLTLFNNPLATSPGYRNFIVKRVPKLRALDEYVITDEEKMTDIGHSYRFKAMSHFMRIFLPEFPEGLNAEQHLIQVDLEIYKLKRIYERNNPSIRIQSLFRGYKQRVAQE